MIRFGLCDTDTRFLSELAGTLHTMFDPCKIEYMYGPSALEVFLCSSAGDVDVLITEIELRGRSAVDIIASYLPDSNPVQVIYITSKIEYCTEVYETRHCGFLLKPVRKDLLNQAVKRAIQSLERTKKSGIMVQKNGCVHIVQAPSLICVEGHGRLIKVVTDSEVLEAYEKIADFIYQLDGRFLQCHKSYVVNMERVSKFLGDSFLMDNGMEVPISQSKRREARERFLDYVGNTTIQGRV